MRRIILAWGIGMMMIHQHAGAEPVIPIEPLPEAPLVSVTEIFKDVHLWNIDCLRSETENSEVETPAGHKIIWQKLTAQASSGAFYFESFRLAADDQLITSDCQSLGSKRACVAFHENTDRCQTQALFLDLNEGHVILEEHQKAGGCTPENDDLGERTILLSCSIY
jgi:hypothetical protein